MLELREIARLVTQHRKKFRESLHLKQKERANEQMLKLFRGVLTDSFKSDAQAAEAIYGSPVIDKRFRMLKGRLMRRMLDDLYFFDQGQRNFSAYFKASFRCSKNYIGARILLLYGARRAATKLLQAVCADAEKFRLYETLMLCYQSLRSNYSFSADIKKFEYYNRKFHEAKREFDAESYSNECLEMLYALMGKTGARKDDIAEMAERYVAEIQKMAANLNGYNLHFNLYRLKIIAHHQRGRYLKAIYECDNAMAYCYTNRPFLQKLRLAEMAMSKMECCLYLRNYNMAEENVVICQKYFMEGTNNWMVFQEVYFLTCLHTGHYDKALEAYQAVTSFAGFSKLPEARLEKWRIFNAYMHLLKNSGYIKNVVEHDRLNLPKFLNELPIFSKDKLGFNLSILIVQFTYLLMKGDFDKVAEKIEMLQSYRSRYLAKNKIYFRSNIFLKMLFFYLKYHDNRKTLLWRTEKLRTELKQHKESAFRSTENQEVVPYEVLWEMLLRRSTNQRGAGEAQAA